jgi:hypothetical protein
VQIARISMRALRIAELAMFDMRQEGSPLLDDLYSALRDIVFRPVKTLAPPWSWKSGALSALLRGITFFIGNLRSGHQHALQTMMVAAVFAIFAAGLIGAVLQRLRASQPVWETAAIVCLGLPALMVVAQLGVHLAGTHPAVGVLASFCFAAAFSAFSWYAMRHGALIGGTDSTSLVHDLRSLPGTMLNFSSPFHYVWPFSSWLSAINHGLECPNFFTRPAASRDC